MMTNFAFTSNQLLLGIFLSIVILFGIIYYGRFLFRKRTEENLTAKYAKKKWASPLTARNKYPDVDVFKLSPIFFRLGLIGALVLTLGAFNWTQYHKQIEQQDVFLSIEEDIEIDVPRSAEPPPPPPPPPPPVIQEVPEELVLEEDEIDFVDQYVDDESMIEIPDALEANTNAPPPPPPPPPPMVEDVREIFVVVEQMPRFPGCEDLKADMKTKKACADKKLLEFLASNVKYPAIAMENGIEGTVIVQFVIEKNGRVTEGAVLRDIGGGCGDEALRLVNLMNEKHTWIPGKQRGKAVPVRFTLPVRFKLQYN